MTPSEEVQRAIDAVYATFSRYRTPSRLDASPRRDGEKILRTLTSASLRELRGEAVGPYAGWALTTVGRVEDYKHFLPRILELAVLKGTWLGADPQSLAEKLIYAGWPQWPVAEREAVLAVYSAAWAQTSRQHPDDVGAEEWLCGLAALGTEVSGLLANWLAPLTADAVLQVASFAWSGPHGPYWDQVDGTARRAIEAWLGGDTVSEALIWATGEVSADDLWRLDQAQLHINQRR